MSLLLPNESPVSYTIASLESMTNAQLQAICDELSISYSTSDVKMKLVSLIANNQNIVYTSDDLIGKTLTQLQAICDGLGISYDGTEDEATLKALILS